MTDLQTTKNPMTILRGGAEIEKLWEELRALLEQFPERYNGAEIRRAFEFSKTAHREQKRKSGEPYICHPLRAAITAAKLRIDTPTIQAALLHDVAEDTAVGLEEIKKTFGEEVAFLVNGVTKLGHVKYRGVETEIDNLRKMMFAMARDIRVILIKIADRLDNMQTLGAVLPQKKRRIALETLDLYAPIARRLGISELAGDLEDLAFPYVYPEEYKWLLEHIANKYEERKRYIERFIPVLKQALEEGGSKPLDIHARAKHYYSLYRKLMKYDMNLERMYDLVAARVVVPTVEDCYLCLGIIHKHWKPFPGRIKDYIAMPKPNGYRSLHTTIFGPGGQVIEIQIRTPEMHDQAERGIVAHWFYSEKDSRAYQEDQALAVPKKELAWVRQLSEWQKSFTGSKEYIEALKIDFFKDRIFVITPKGDVIDLPEGATPVDFAYHIHTDIGNQCAGVRVNTKIVALDRELQSGDIVEILVQKNKKPSESWLEFVKTSFAKNKIREALRKNRGGPGPKPMPKEAEFRLEAKDRVGLLKDVSQTFSGSNINITEVTTKTEERYPVMVIRAELRDRQKAEKLAVKLRKIKGVEGVSYKMK